MDKSCPFCNAKVENSDGIIHHKPDCYIMVHFYENPTRKKDIKAWNTRPIEEALQMEIVALKLELETYKGPETGWGKALEYQSRYNIDLSNARTLLKVERENLLIAKADNKVLSDQLEEAEKIIEKLKHERDEWKELVKDLIEAVPMQEDIKAYNDLIDKFGGDKILIYGDY